MKELDRIKQVCKNNTADHYMVTSEAIDKLGVKVDGSTIKAYTPPNLQDIRSSIRCVLPSGNRRIGNNISRWIIDEHKKSE